MNTNLKIKLLTLFLSTFVLNIFAQDKIYYPNQSISGDNFTIEISNIVGLASEIKFKLEIDNKSNEYLLLDASRCIFTVNGEKVVPRDKFFIIEPYKKRSKTILALGKGYNKVREFSFELNGLQKITDINEIKGIEAFNLPPSSNDFNANDFKINLKNFSKETNETTSKYNVQYTGQKIGFVNPSKISVLMPDGNTYANAKKSDTFILFPGESGSFSANWDRMPGGKVTDMQKVVMSINFNNVFSEGTASDLPSYNLDFKWDEALTKSKK